MRFLSGLLIAVVTRTLVRAHHVLADAVGADAAGPGTFIDVCRRSMKISNFPHKLVNTIQPTFAGSAVGSQFVTCRTLAAVASGRVDAFASSAQSRSPSALVDVFNEINFIFQIKIRSK